MILVVGRPGLDEQGRLLGSAGLVAEAAARAGARVELVGSVGDDSAGEGVALALGQAGIGHAALLRDPAAATPRGKRADPAGSTGRGEPGNGPLPRLEAADLELGLHYLAECRVIVVAEPLDAPALSTAAEAAAYHGAALVAIVAPGPDAASGLPSSATVLEMPAEDDDAFPALVGRYAAELDAGRPAADAWQAALASSTWEPVEE